jgi:phosphoribosylglycinamide formyltransferase 1
MDTFRIAVLISGRGSNLEALLQKRSLYDVSVVLSDEPAARGLDIARSYGVPTVVAPRGSSSSTDFNQALVQALQPYAPRLVVLAGFMRIVNRAFIDAFNGNVINIHPALLPSFPGLNVQQQALDAGVKIAGCTVHYATCTVDGGPIIAQACVTVQPGESADALSARILRQEHRLLPAVVKAIAAGQIELVEGTRVRISEEILAQESCMSIIEGDAK